MRLRQNHLLTPDSVSQASLQPGERTALLNARGHFPSPTKSSKGKKREASVGHLRGLSSPCRARHSLITAFGIP